MKWLQKEYDVDQMTIEFIMAADKQAQQAWIQQLDDDGVDVLVLDRYTGSQLVYAQANGLNPVFARQLQSHMRKPDWTILIDVPAEISMSRKGKHNNGENDRYESDKLMLERVRKLYLEHIKPKDLWVDGTQSIHEIHSDIMNYISRKRLG